MHRLQQHILSELIKEPVRRYADLKPVEVEGNLFMYHLRALMKAGHVHKRDDGRYELTPEGQRYVDALSLKTLTPRAQPRIVTLLVVKNEAGEYLFLRRKRQPLFAQTGFPYGKIHLGERIADAANRELLEKTGLTATLTHRGDGYVTIHEDGEPTSQIMFHLFYGENPTGQLTTETDTGSVFWARPEAITGVVMPSVSELLRLLGEHADKRFFVELVYN